MSELRYTLVTDGASDVMFLPVLDWLLQQHASKIFIPQWADLRRLRTKPATLAHRVRAALDLYPCELLFVHRDAAAPWAHPGAGTQACGAPPLRARHLSPPLTGRDT